MGFRFRQRIKVFPGVHINLTAKGVSSVSLGGPGATINVGKKMRVTATAGLPGTGLSYRQVVHPGSSTLGRRHLENESSVVETQLEQVRDSSEPSGLDVLSYSAAEWSESSMDELQNIIFEAHQQHNLLETELSELRTQVQEAEQSFERRNKWYRRLFQRRALDEAASNLANLRNELSDATQAVTDQGVAIDWTLPERLKHLFQVFVISMRKLSQQSPSIWRIGGSTQIDRIRERTSYNTLHDREPASLTFECPPFMPTRPGEPYAQVPCLKAANGFALYFFPSFVAVVRGSEFGLIRPTSLIIDMEWTDFVETEVPPGARVTGQTWRYVNKDGSPDRRYSDNPSVPIVTYEQLRLTSEHAFNEVFLFTDGSVNFSSWVEICDWFDNAEKRKELESLPQTSVVWQLRKEDDACYITAPYKGEELIGFGITHKDANLWVCLSVSHLGVELQPGTNIRYWLDDEPLVVGALSTSRKVSKESAAHRAWPQDSDYPELAPFKRLASARELFISVETDGKPILQLRVALSGVAGILGSIIPSVAHEGGISFIANEAQKATATACRDATVSSVGG